MLASIAVSQPKAVEHVGATGQPNDAYTYTGFFFFILCVKICILCSTQRWSDHIELSTGPHWR